MKNIKLTAKEFLDAYENDEFDTNIVMDELFEYVKENEIITIQDNIVSSENNRVQGRII